MWSDRVAQDDELIFSWVEWFKFPAALSVKWLLLSYFIFYWFTQGYISLFIFVLLVEIRKKKYSSSLGVLLFLVRCSQLSFSIGLLSLCSPIPNERNCVQYCVLLPVMVVMLVEHDVLYRGGWVDFLSLLFLILNSISSSQYLNKEKHFPLSSFRSLIDPRQRKRKKEEKEKLLLFFFFFFLSLPNAHTRVPPCSTLSFRSPTRESASLYSARAALHRTTLHLSIDAIMMHDGTVGSLVRWRYIALERCPPFVPLCLPPSLSLLRVHDQ